MVNLEKLFSDVNLRIFEILINESLSVRDLARKVNCSPAKITQFVGHFGDLIKIEKKKNMKFLLLDKENTIVRELISLIFINKIINSEGFLRLKKVSKSIGIYGSVVDGTIDNKSDIDLWIINNKKISIIEIGKLKFYLSKELKREVSIKSFNDEDLKKLKNQDLIFYNELYYKSKIIFGSGF